MDEKLNGINAPILDDIDYSDNTVKKGAPKGVAAPILDDMEDFSYSGKKGAPKDVAAPVLDDMKADYNPHPKKPESDYVSDDEVIAKFSPEQRQQFYMLPDDKKKMVLDYTRKQLGLPTEPEPEIKAPILDDEDYVPDFKQPEHILDYEEPLAAPVLDEQPDTPEYVPKFTDENLEKIKQDAKKEAVNSQLTQKQKDEKESLRMMNQLREEREIRDAKKGFKLTIIVAVAGCVAAILFVLFASGNFLGLSYKPDIGKAPEIVSQYSLYIGAVAAVCSLLLITGLKPLKSLATFVFLVFTIILIFPGIIMLTQKDGNMPLNAILYGLSVIGSGYTFFSLTTNNKIHLFFTKKY